MPWRNGGGETVEVAIHPPGADMEAFDWRISTAGVATDGPFSAFSNIDRTLLVLAGGPMELAVAGQSPILLDQRSEPFAFPGDAPTTAALKGAPVTDLNVMTRRGRFAHAVRKLDLAGPEPIDRGRDVCIMYCWEGGIEAGGSQIGPGDALVLSGPCTLAPLSRDATVALIQIWAV